MDKKTDTASPERDDPLYQQLIQEQEEIGWDQLYHGRWSLQWAEMQEKKKVNSGENWICNVIWTIWIENHKLWKPGVQWHTRKLKKTENRDNGNAMLG